MGAASGTLTLATNGGTQTVSLGGTGRQAKPAVTPGTLAFGDQRVATTSGAQTLTLSNSGNAATALGQAQVTGPFAVSTTCGATLAGGAGCTYSLTFNPVAMGAATGSVVIPTDAGNQTVSLSGNGLLAVGSATPASVGFGNQGVGTTSAAKVITLSNSGNMALDVTNVTVTGPFLLTNNCGTSVAASANCTASVAFAPTARGAQSGSLVFTTSDGAKAVALSGTGLQAVVGATPATLAFGNQTVGSTSVAQTVTVSNTGNTTSALSTATISGPFAFTTTCAASLAAGASCSYSVTFSPVAMNAATGTLTVPSDVGTNTVSLSRFGQQTSGSLSTGALAFGNQAVSSSSAAQSVKLTNTGNLALAITSVTASGHCTYSVTYTPSTMGADSGTLSIPTGVGAKTVSLGGTGLQTSGSVPVGSLAFGNQAVSTTSSAQSVVLSNTGNTALAVSSVTVSGQYGASHNCPASLAVGATCTVNVTFAPVTLGAQSGTLTIATNGGNQAVSLSGTGLLAVLAASPSSLAFGNQTVGTTSASQTVTLTNSGNTSATLSHRDSHGPVCPGVHDMRYSGFRRRELYVHRQLHARQHGREQRHPVNPDRCRHPQRRVDG
ncbi:Ice nucleation protein, putative [Ricinus communis]|uniref:Ice nucleation protein, putative n=1 Tax=Ricinus communis TaxID=3988 RepID=B9TAU2_RICCO|nr:Ice nucleation protein, putative [Ricinus communis]